MLKPPLPPARSACVGVVLAAGHGSRYAAVAPGQDKLLAPLPDGTPILQAAIRAMRGATRRPLVVTRADAAARRALAESLGCDVLVLPPQADGMGDSLAAAARYLLDTCDASVRRCVVALADMPWLRADTCARVAMASITHGTADPAASAIHVSPPIIVPTWQGRRGHPVAFDRSLWRELAALSGDVGARALLARHEVMEVAVDDPAIHLDVDTPQDLNRAG